MLWGIFHHALCVNAAINLNDQSATVQALRPQVAVPHGPLLLIKHRAFRAIHVERDNPRPAAVTYRVDPTALQFDLRPEVLRPGQHRGLEEAHGIGRGRATLHRLAADELAHHRVTVQPVDILDVLIAR
jgi:hypothetical protein